MHSEADSELAAALTARAEADQAIRYRLIDAERERGLLSWDDPISVELRRVDDENTAWLQALVDRRGWPMFSEVGEQAARKAWLLVQHSGDVEFMERCCGLLRDAVAHGEGDPKDLAWLEDRISMNRGCPQRYGSQWINEGNGYELWPLEDPERVDEWRAELGIGPVEDYRPK